MSWLPEEFAPPLHLELETGAHLRPIKEADVDIDYPAVMASRERLWARYGTAWGWPPEDLSFEDDRRELARHERENAEHVAFNYAVLNADESALLGCVYIDPPDARSAPGSDALVTWWLVDDAAGTELERELTAFVPHWLATSWPFSSVEYPP